MSEYVIKIVYKGTQEYDKVIVFMKECCGVPKAYLDTLEDATLIGGFF